MKKFLFVLVAYGLVVGLVGCGGGQSLEVDTSLEDVTGIDEYGFDWFDYEPLKKDWEEWCDEDREKCYLLDGKIKEITLEPYRPDEIRGSCDVGGDLTIDDDKIVDDLEDGKTVVLTKEDFEVFSFEIDDGETTVNAMSFYISDCDYVRVTVKT